MIHTHAFATLSRQQFRRYFQPSRIVLGVIPAPCISGVNVITLCFDMYCSYKPPMMAVAVHKINASHELILRADHWVLAVPGQSLIEETMYCGTVSARNDDKVKRLRLELTSSQKVPVPGIKMAIANIEIRRVTCIETGDHVMAIGEVLRFAVRSDNRELPLLSIGPRTDGYRVLARSGIHRIAIVDDDSHLSQ